MSEWKEVRLGDIIDLVIDYRGKTPKKLGGDWSSSGYRALSAKNIKTGQIVQKDSIRYVDESLYKRWMQEEVKRGDILITSEAPFGQIYLWDSDEKIVLSQRLFDVRIRKEHNSTFVYYQMQTRNFQSELDGRTTGTTVVGLRQPELLKCHITIPDINTQNQIAGILSSLDAKIETNNMLNEKLEEMAQAIFKSWFVDFEPFKDKPFHETELGMIPEGWEVGIFEDIVDIVGGGTPSKSISEYYTDNGIAWITPKDLSLNNNKFTSKGTIDITELGYEKSSAKLMPKGSVLFSSRAPIGYITIAKNEICTNQGFKSAVPKKAGTAFVYYLLKNKTIEIENMATGSTFKEASGTLMKNLKIIIPLDKVLDDFEKIMMPIFEFQMSVEEQNDRLASLRDTLLPRLMSGELKV